MKWLPERPVSVVSPFSSQFSVFASGEFVDPLRRGDEDRLVPDGEVESLRLEDDGQCLAQRHVIHGQRHEVFSVEECILVNEEVDLLKLRNQLEEVDDFRERRFLETERFDRLVQRKYQWLPLDEHGDEC